MKTRIHSTAITGTCADRAGRAGRAAERRGVPGRKALLTLTILGVAVAGMAVAAFPGAASAQDASGGDGGVTAAAQLSVRVDQLQEQVRQLTGQVEELTHQESDLANRLDKYMKDSEFRFEALEKGNPPGAGGATTGTTGAAGTAGALGATGAAGAGTASAAGNAADVTSPSAPGVKFIPGLQPHALGQIPANTALPQPQPGDTAGAAAGASASAGGLPAGSAQSQYNYATGLLRQGRYADAEQALTGFVRAHPGDPLAASAQFWLGETFYVRKQYDKAASTFLTAYQKYPKSNKAPDDLLKLGASLTNLHQKQEACATFAQLANQFPHAEPRIKQATARERERAGCQ